MQVPGADAGVRDTNGKVGLIVVAHHSMKMRIEVEEIVRAAQCATLNK
jgi:hypothetical protein